MEIHWNKIWILLWPVLLSWNGLAQEVLLGSDKYEGTRILPDQQVSRSVSLNFDLTLFNFTPEAESAFHYAVGLLAPYLNSSQMVRVQAIYGLPLPGGTLGVCIPNSDRDFSLLATDSTWYPAALSNALTGMDLQSSELDLNIFIGNASWYTGTDGNCPSNNYDLVSVVLHELIHGMGFISLMSMEGGSGKYGDPDSSNFQFTTFPMPDFSDMPGIYDRHLYHNGSVLTDASMYGNPSVALGQALRSDSVFFSGPETNFLLSGDQARIFAPPVFQDGSSIHHLDENSYPAGSVYSLMTPYIGLSEVNHSVDSLTLAILSDIGWGSPGLGISERTSSDFEVYPVPVNDIIHLQSSSELKSCSIIGLDGMEVLSLDLSGHVNYAELNVRTLGSGLYVLIVNTGEGSYSRKILIH